MVSAFLLFVFYYLHDIILFVYCNIKKMNSLREKNCLIKLLILCFMSLTAIPCFAVEEQNIELVEKEKQQIVTKIDFDEILVKAKEHSYDLKISDYNELISKQGVRGARSEYFPKLNFSTGMEYTRNFRDVNETTVMSIGDAFINPYTRFQSILGINVGYNLFDFGVRGGNLKIAKEDVKIKELETKQKLQELNLTLLDSYTKILVTTKQIDTNKEILKLAQKNLEYKERLYNAKEVSKTELNDARVQVSIAKNRIQELNIIRAEALSWLSFYTGEVYDSDNIKVADIKMPDFDTSEFQDYTKSLVWKIHEKNIKKKELELYVAKRTNYPKLNVYSKYYLYGSNYSNIGKSMGITPSNFSIGAFLNMPLFDGFKNSANIKKTALELKQLQVERDKAIAQLSARLAAMRSNLIYLDEQISDNKIILSELTDKEKSVHKLLSKRLISPIEENDVKIEKLNQKIEFEKNSATKVAITKGIQILTEE